ncbi:hypothetical protein HOLleu_00363 [Holothuria leucospilota]|uniref:Reverse transcriptase domain-containing protein n=1 Tax=Holothuria leucospilota TaxID=206669 RepID=A0A9Q1CPI5_HOLLE|nr:hypothetical protein HOLleu_00363 [Holothuria leucospilota]
MYADDIQLYITMKSQDKEFTVKKIEDCIHDTKGWMVANFLILNDSKTEVLHVTSKFSNAPQITHLTAGVSQVLSTQSARNLGASFDTNLNMTSHINNISRGASCALRKISKIRKYIDKPTTEKVFHASSASRLVSLTGIKEHITPVIRYLHWLPVNQRITYKILILTFEILNHMSPDYLTELITPYTPSRVLRSSLRSLTNPFF